MNCITAAVYACVQQRFVVPYAHSASYGQATTRTVAVRAEGAKRYGYTAANRRAAICPYSTNLRELVADLFERMPGQRGTPVH